MKREQMKVEVMGLPWEVYRYDARPSTRMMSLRVCKQALQLCLTFQSFVLSLSLVWIITVQVHHSDDLGLLLGRYRGQDCC